MSRSKTLSTAEVAKVLENSADAAKPAAKMPSWGDIKDGFKAVVTEGENGICEANVPLGPKEKGLLMEMYAPAWRAEGERSQEVRGRQSKATIRVGGGRRAVPVEHAETVERRLYSPRATITVPEMPWKRKKEDDE